MGRTDWVQHLRESFVALAAGGQMVPMGDNATVHRLLAVRLARVRGADPRRSAPAGTRRGSARVHADDCD